MSALNSQQAFWGWFVRRESDLYHFDPNHTAQKEKLFDQLATELQKVDAGLAFEFGPKQAQREFVISAGGIKRAFPAVVALAQTAPPIARWKVTAFRQRRWPLNVIDFQGKRVDPKDVQFTLLDNGAMAGLYLFIPGFREKDVALKSIGYLMLDEALGEYDVESRLGLIKMLSPDQQTDGDRYPLVELPTLFDQLVSRLEGRSGKSS
jgi:hypothetical protein